MRVMRVFSSSHRQRSGQEKRANQQPRHGAENFTDIPSFAAHAPPWSTADLKNTNATPGTAKSVLFDTAQKKSREAANRVRAGQTTKPRFRKKARYITELMCVCVCVCVASAVPKDAAEVATARPSTRKYLSLVSLCMCIFFPDVRTFFFTRLFYEVKARYSVKVLPVDNQKQGGSG